MKGLLLGAGFSYDLGMPLASGFTEIFLSFLKPERVSKMMEEAKRWRPYGENIPLSEIVIADMKHIYDDFVKSECGNYEELFRQIENKNYVSRETRNAILGTWKDIINELFFMYQMETMPIYLKNRHLYGEFLRELCKEEELWIVSLNHDLLIEMLCMDYGIPFKTGSDKIIDIPYSNENHEKRIEFMMRNAVAKDTQMLDFYEHEPGINLLKLHGGLNEFKFGDGISNPKTDVILSLEGCRTSCDYISRLNDFLHQPHYLVNVRTMPVGGEIVVSDDENVVQFFKNSILTGSKKYHNTLEEWKDEEKMELFSNILSKLDELYVIGYSFGDTHINHRIEHAMHLSDHKKVIIINPADLTYSGLDAFSYGTRVLHHRLSFPVWADYEKSGKWAPYVEEDLEQTNVLRKMINDIMKKYVLSLEK